MTKIPWTEETINPWVGCTKIATGCTNCYAEQMARRLRAIGHKAYADVIGPHGKWTGRIGYQWEQLDKLKKGPPRMVFLCSMTDPFHEDVSIGDLTHLFDAIKKYPQHTFQLLTKRPEQALKMMWGTHEKGWRYFDDGDYHPNLWLGTSISTQADADKNIPILLEIPAAVRFVSLEPMLERIDFYGEDGTFMHDFWQSELLDSNNGVASYLHWVIIGCESGPGARLCTNDDIRYVNNQCREAGVPFLNKQVIVNGKCNKNPNDWDEDLRIQEYPK